MRGRIVLAVIALTLAADYARANNLTAGTAYSIKPGATAEEGFLDATNTQRWYRFLGIVGRSYCVETQGGVHFDTSATADIDTAVSVYRADGTTLVTFNDDDPNEPDGFWTSRACFVWTTPPTTDTTVLIKVSQSTFAGTAPMSFRVHVSESTLFSNWFFVGGDYNAFTLIRNTTSTSLNYTLNYRNSTGAIVASQSATLSGNGSAVINARTFPAAVTAGSGTVEIVHNSSPDAIAASTTVMSASTGLSFDAPFMKRSNW